MKRIIIMTAVLGALALPGAAHANWYVTKRGAERIARDAVSKRYHDYGFTYSDTAASCRPQNRAYNPAYKYHRWVCGWAGHDWDGELCSGTLLIVGASSAGGYYDRVLSGGRC